MALLIRVAVAFEFQVDLPDRGLKGLGDVLEAGHFPVGCRVLAPELVEHVGDCRALSERCSSARSGHPATVADTVHPHLSGLVVQDRVRGVGGVLDTCAAVRGDDETIRGTSENDDSHLLIRADERIPA